LRDLHAVALRLVEETVPPLAPVSAAASAPEPAPQPA
jgi:hypothetical protein